MASSDDEDEALFLSVTNYHFVDDGNEHASFAVLPIQWTASERMGGKSGKLYLLGNADNGLQSIHKHVVAWKFDLSNVKPEISVLSKENSWIKLEKPRKFFEGVIRSIMVTVHCLHYVQRNPEASGKSLWDHLSKIFSSYEVRPSEIDLNGHVSLITEAVERNDVLAKSKFLTELLKKDPEKRGLPDEGIQAKPMSEFIISDSDDDIMDGGEDDESDQVDVLFDSACSLCDNGGDLLCCEGSCLRSFHATVEDGEDCESLGFTEEEANALTSQSTQEFLCKNCEFKRHQCFICGELGSSDKSSGAEVFRCVSATCGKFYHPHCVAKMLHRDDKVAAADLEKKIPKGGSFICPVHKCCVCKQVENKKDHQLQFAVCRRCPKSYHRKCMPKKILFESNVEEGIPPRAWENLLPNRILIFCLKHEIVEEIGTPVRNHIQFPGVEEKKSTLGKNKPTIDEKRQNQSSEMLGDRKKIESKTRVHLEEPHRERTTSALKQTKKSSSALKPGGNKSFGKLASGSSIPRKVKANGLAKKELKSPRAEENKSSLGNRNGSSEPVNQWEQDTENDDLNTAALVKRDTNFSSGLPLLDADSQKRVLDIMESVKSSINIDDIRKKTIIPSTHGSSQKLFDDKSISQGKVETSVRAVREAVRILEEGGCIEDAEEVCSRDLLAQIFKWKSKLKLHISPFLHGMRYTSYGRHFTKVEKLEEIVNRVHWYLQDGDTLVDFCCGPNDFSVLMRKKLVETGKKCSFKNYDLFPAKIDFNFECRDWMSVKPNELPAGSKLVMGLNPPFGVRACQANKFIDKALEFNPKLLILIVPPETQRLDEKETPYDLIWEDDTLLAGKSFYLPGSIDARDKQMDQWNLRPPLLYLWSRPDWSSDHRSIAKAQRHISDLKMEADERSHYGPMVSDQPTGNHDNGDRDVYYLPMGGGEDNADIPPHATNEDNPMLMTDYPMETDNLNGHKEISPSSSSDGGSPGSYGHGKKPFGETSRKRPRKAKKNRRRTRGRASTERRQDNGRPHNAIVPSYTGDRENIYHHPEQYIPAPPRAPLDYDNGSGSRSPYTGPGESIHQHLDAGVPVPLASRPPLTSSIDSIARRYLDDTDVEEHFSRFPDRPPSDPPAVMGYGVRNLDGLRFTAQAREATDGLSGRHVDESVRSQLRTYGWQDPNLTASGYSPSQDARFFHIEQGASFSAGYGHMGSTVDGPYRISPTGAQIPPRYQTRPDELHHSRMNTFGAELPQPAPYGNGGFFPPGYGPPGPAHHGHPGGPSAFAPGRHDGYPHHGSGGWIP